MVGAVIQARSGSTRFPDKVFAHIGGVPLLQLVIDRCRTAETVDTVIVATTQSPADDRLAEACTEWGVAVVRGSEDDVLGRFLLAIDTLDLDTVVRVTADDPFKDPDVIDRAVALLGSTYDYVSNTVRPSYPEGLDIEVVTAAALRRADAEATRPSEREHVTPYIWNNPERFRVHNFALPTDRSHLRWTVDYETDLTAMNALLRATGRPAREVKMNELLAAVDADPSLATANTGVVRNEGYLKSLRAEDATHPDGRNATGASETTPPKESHQ